MENINSKEFRSRARASLKNNWGQAIFVIIAYLFITALINFFLNHLLGKSLVFLNQIILIPLILGVCFYFLNLSRNKQSFENLFEIFKSKLWLKALGLYIFYFIGAFITFIPLIITLTLIALQGHTHVAPSSNHTISLSVAYILGVIIGFVLGLFIFLVLLIPFIIYAYTFSQLNLIFLDNKDLSIIEIFKKSRKMMKGFKKKLFFLQLSYIGWFLLSIIPLGIGLLWFIPYFVSGEIAFYKEIKDINFSHTEDYILNIDNSIGF